MKLNRGIFILSIVALGQLSYGDCLRRNSLESVYAIDIKLGEKNFTDLLVISEACQSGWNGVEIEGTLTVPGIFTTKILQGIVIDQFENTAFRENYTFTINTIEGTTPIKVLYEFTDVVNYETKKHTCSGNAYFNEDPEAVPFKCYRLEKDSRYIQKSVTP